MTDRAAPTADHEPRADREGGEIGIATCQAAGIVTLASAGGLPVLRPRACTALAAAYRAFALDPIVYAAVIRSMSSDVFCAGLDYGRLIAPHTPNPDQARQAIADSLRLCWTHDCFSKPTVSLIDGSVLGGGFGIALFGTHRVGGARFIFSCPETGLGLVPANGMSWVLARLPDAIGIYLALTGHALGPVAAFRLGLLTHLIGAERFAAIEAHLADADPVDALLDILHEAPGHDDLAAAVPTISRCFSADSVEEIVSRLETVAGADATWTAGTAADLRQKSPLALKVTHALLAKARSLDLRAALELECRVSCRLIAGHDFHNAMHLPAPGKHSGPAWSPFRLEDVTPDMVSQCFAADPRLALGLLPRARKQTARRASSAISD